MKRAALITLLAAGCFPAAPPMTVEESCAFDDTTIQVEHGAMDSCAHAQIVLRAYREAYEERFGHADLTGRPVRLRAASDLRGETGEDFAVGGITFADAIDLANGALPVLAHELHHVRNGLGHHAWCEDYAPWSKSVLGWNQDAYLGCTSQ